jgi:hypothetical protein
LRWCDLLANPDVLDDGAPNELLEFFKTDRRFRTIRFRLVGRKIRNRAHIRIFGTQNHRMRRHAATAIQQSASEWPRTAVEIRAGLDDQSIVSRLYALGGDTLGGKHRLCEQVAGREHCNMPNVSGSRSSANHPVTRAKRIRRPLRRHSQDPQQVLSALLQRPIVQGGPEQPGRRQVGRGAIAKLAQ